MRTSTRRRPQVRRDRARGDGRGDAARRVAPAHLEAIDGRERDLHRVEGLDRRDRRVGTGEQRHLAAVRRRSRPTAQTASRVRTSAALTCSSTPAARLAPRPSSSSASRASSRPVSCSTRSAMTSAACGSASRARTPGTPRSSRSTPSTSTAAEIRVSASVAAAVAEPAERGEGAVERLDQAGGVGNTARRAPTNDPDDATHGKRD